jgi:type IV pilus assembly protein PilE
MMVVVIIAILAALAIPRFTKAAAKNKQSEAKSILKQIYVMQRAYRQEKDTYITSTGAGPGQNIAPLYIEVMNTARYSYVLAGNANSFTATATCIYATGLDEDATQDIWRVDETGTLTAVSDDTEG